MYLFDSSVHIALPLAFTTDKEPALEKVPHLHQTWFSATKP